MNDQSRNPTSFHIVVADPIWNATETTVADAYVVGDEVRIEPREGMYVEDEDRLKEAIKRGKNRFQAEGSSMQETWHLPSSLGLDKETKVNAWRYLITPTETDKT